VINFFESGDRMQVLMVNGGRRRVIAGMAVASLIATVPVGQAFAQSSVKVGVVLAKQGPFAQQAGDMAKGVQLAVEDLGRKIGGKPMEIVWLDEPNPQVAVQNFTKLVDQENVIAVVGGSNSPTSLAMGAAALQRKVPFISINAAAREVTGKDCNPFLFRMAASVPVYARAMAPHMIAVGKRWYILSGSYAFGEDVINTFTDLAKASGATIVGVDRAPVATTDYSSFVLKARAARPDVLISGVPNVEPILKQVRELGLSGSMTVAGAAVSDTDLWAASPDSLGGIYGKTWYYNDPSNSPEEQAFTKRYIASEGRPPSDRVFFGWHSMNLLAAAINQAKSTDRVAITQALTTMKLSDGGLPFGFRDWDHQLTRRLVVGAAKQNTKDKWDVLTVKSAKPTSADELNKLYGSKAEVGCNMAPL
jgi:branched-chain amino acid transport system substrate-binding protein